MRIRPGLLRALTGALAALLVAAPVGRGGGGGTVGLFEGFGRLARGHIDPGVLSALAAGGSMTSAALVRLSLIVAAAVAFYLSGKLRRPVEEKAAERQRTCSACGFVTARRMTDCPACGARIR